MKIGKHEDKMALRLSPTNEVIFDDVRIPAANIIGAEGKGFGIAMRALEYARVATMSFAVCIRYGRSTRPPSTQKSAPALASSS